MVMWSICLLHNVPNLIHGSYTIPLALVGRGRRSAGWSTSKVRLVGSAGAADERLSVALREDVVEIKAGRGPRRRCRCRG